MGSKIRIAVVDDHPLVRLGIREALSEAGDFEICAEGNTASDAEAIANQSQPDLMMLDVNMPGNGLSALVNIVRQRPECKVVILSIHEDQSTVRAAMKAGAWGYIAKGIDGNDLVEALRKINSGTKYIEPGLAAQLFSDEHGPSSQSIIKEKRDTASILSERELQILGLLGDGLSNDEIAEKLSLRGNTIKHYMTPLFKKLGVRNRTEAALLSRKSR